ncbi:MAG: hypothetical protein GY820_46730, partial [Gammaproteobacteria bacterium]|nr:hypothetical protein [Gammaproteobacteria bacterium]
LVPPRDNQPPTMLELFLSDSRCPPQLLNFLRFPKTLTDNATPNPCCATTTTTLSCLTQNQTHASKAKTTKAAQCTYHFPRPELTKNQLYFDGRKRQRKCDKTWSVAKLLRDITTLPKSRQISPLKITDIDKSLFFRLRSSYKIHL